MAKINLELIVKAAKAIAQFQKVRAQTEKVRASTAKINAQTNIYNERLRQQAARTKTLTNRLKKTEQQVRRTSNAFDVFKGVLGAQVFTSIVRNLGSLAASSVAVTGELETLRTQFEVLTGSAGSANKAVQDLQQFAANTPFQFKDLARATQRLLSFGFTLEESQENLKDLGDVAAASGGDINDLALIFGQVQAAGKLTGERLLQLQERAIPIGPAIARTLGVAESAVRELVSQGKVDFKTFEEAFKSLNDEGQFAFEGTIKRARTLEGRISTLKDNFELLQANIGARLGPAFKALLSTVTIFIQRIQQTQAFNAFLDTLSSSIPSAIDIAIDSLSFIINTALNLGKAFNNIRSSIATAISAILDSVAGFLKGFAKVEEFFGGDTFAKADREFAATLESLSDGFDETAREFDQSARDIEASQKVINDAIKEGRDLIKSTYAEEIRLSEEQANAVVENNTRVVTSEKALTEEQLKEIEKRRQAKQKLIEDIKMAEMELAVQQEANRLFEQEREQIFTEQKLLALQEYFTREEEANIQAQINAAQSEEERQKLILDAQLDGQKKRLAAMQRAKDEEQKINALRQTSAVQTFRETSNLITAILGNESKAAFAISKAAAFAENIVRTQQALATISATYAWNPPLAASLSAQETTRGVIRGATIAATAITGFETGGIVPGTSFTGDNNVIRANSREMVLTQQQQSRLFQLANGQGMGGGGGQTFQANVVVELDNEVVGRATSKWVANGGQLGEVQ